MPAQSQPFQGHRPGDPGFRRISVALFLAGVATFALLYAPQPLLPAMSSELGITPATATLSISVTTLGLGIALLVAGPLTELLGRTPLMFVSLFASSIIGVACAFAHDWGLFLVLRGLQGVTLAGLPAVATAYLREEIHPSAVARATGLYIGGTALGGMSGRLIGGAVADLAGWHIALGANGVLGLLCAIAVFWLLPRSRNFHPASSAPKDLARTAWRVIADPALLALYGISGCLMGGFVAVYNTMGFRLAGPEFALPLSLASLIFLSYAVGSVASSTAGGLADRHGRRLVVPLSIALGMGGLAITLSHQLWLVIAGLVILTAGFFAAHGVASGWVTARAGSRGGGTGQAASIYLFAYYLGSSVFGSLSGIAWAHSQWQGVITMVGVLWLIALGLSLLLRRIPAIPTKR